MKTEAGQPALQPALFRPIVTFAALALAVVALLTSNHGTTGTTVCTTASTEDGAAMTGKTLSALHARVAAPESERESAPTF